MRAASLLTGLLCAAFADPPLLSARSRLHSHRSAVTSLHFIPHPTIASHPGYLLSTSLDTLLKLWDLQTSHCIQTVVAHRAAVSASHMRFVPGVETVAVDEEGEEVVLGGGGSWEVVTASGEGEVKGWEILEETLVGGLKETADGDLPEFVCPLAALPLPTSSSPITHIRYHPTAPLLFILTSDKTLSVLRIRTEAEIEKKKARRTKRAKEKKKEAGGAAAADADADVAEKEYSWGDRFALWTQVHGGAKIKSFSFPAIAAGESATSAVKPTLSLLLHLTTNTLESHAIPLPPSGAKPPKTADAVEPKRLAAVEVQGHRSDVRALDISAGDDMLASGSNGQLKVWNLKSLACIRTMDAGYVVCLSWLPGDRHVRRRPPFPSRRLAAFSCSNADTRPPPISRPPPCRSLSAPRTAGCRCTTSRRRRSCPRSRPTLAPSGRSRSGPTRRASSRAAPTRTSSSGTLRWSRSRRARRRRWTGSACRGS